ncbi:MAG: hypothetical protein WD802_04490 [Gemmatimonadaceae bacterium]
MERWDDVRPLTDGEIEAIMATDFTYSDLDGVRVTAALHEGFSDIPADITLSVGFGETCCNGLVLPPDAARELAWTLLKAADVLDNQQGR